MSILKYLPYAECFWNKKKLFEVTYFVTNQCNFKCPFCFNTAKSGKILSLETVEELAEGLGPFCRLLISGGEPFLNKNLPEICRIFIEKCKVLHITIPTNGYLSSRVYEQVDEICGYSKDVTINISLSIDDIGEDRDKLVGIPDSFEKLTSTLRMLSFLTPTHKNLFVGSITTQCPQNELHLYRIFNYVHSLNLDYFSFNAARGTHYNVGIYRRFYRFLLSHSKRRLPVPFFKLKQKLVFDAVLNKPSMQCHSGTLRKVIAADGTIHDCETKMFGGGCPCWHECDLAPNLFFNWRTYGRQK